MCRQVGYYLDRDDMVTQTMSTFASSTVHCARCHDHKFDPISQSDYYALQADFAGVVALAAVCAVGAVAYAVLGAMLGIVRLSELRFVLRRQPGLTSIDPGEQP
jgi:hypothetical protein